MFSDVIRSSLPLFLSPHHFTLALNIEEQTAMSFTEVTLEGCRVRHAIVDSDTSSVAQTWLDGQQRHRLRHKPLLLQFLLSSRSIAASLHFHPCARTEFDVFLGRDALSLYREACGDEDLSTCGDSISASSRSEVSHPLPTVESLPTSISGARTYLIFYTFIHSNSVYRRARQPWSVCSCSICLRTNVPNSISDDLRAE